MKSWQKQANTIAGKLAQMHLSEILRIAYNSLEQDTELQNAARKYLLHRMNEHSLAKAEKCQCEICKVYNNLQVLRNTAQMYQDALKYSDDKRFYRRAMKDVHKALFEEHNKRRRLMGLPEKEFKPSSLWRSHRLARNDDSPYFSSIPKLIDISGSTKVNDVAVDTAIEPFF